MALHLAFEQHSKQTGRPIFYVDSLDDLICSASFIHRQGDKGELTKGPGGRLFDFLTTPYAEGCEPLIIINYAHFMPDDIVRFNSLLDDKRAADGTSISSTFKIMGLIDVNNPDCYQGQDFYSRLNKVEACPLSADSLAAAGAEPPLFAADASEEVPTHTISLYQGIDWKEQLLGHWMVDGEHLTFKKGKLIEALEQGHTAIALHEAPWDNPQFKHFWQQAAIRGGIGEGEGSMELPENFRLFKREGYDWAKLAQNVVIDNTASVPDGATLNPACSYAFLAQYICNNETRSLHMLPGKLEEAAGQLLHVNLTRDLNKDDWARLLDECQKHQVKLVVHAPPSIELSASLFEHTQTLPIAVDSPELPDSVHTQVIESTEVDTTVAMLTRDEPFLVIDISECGAHQLLTQVSGAYDASQQRLVFKETVGAVLTALAEGKNVILKGTFSPAKGEPSLKAWVEDSSDKLKVLFIDEANIGSRQWSEFEGLFNSPPSILIDGKIHMLTPEHKVIFAGNPLSYGQGRSLPSLFKRHGNSLVFDPLPPAFIYEVLLKPVFANTPLAEDAEVISSVILSVYERLGTYTSHEVLISPRELQMMALLVLSHCAKQPDANPQEMAAHYAYQLAAPLVPAQHRADFVRDFTPTVHLQREHDANKLNKPSGFLMTPSREPLVAALEDRLALRELRAQVSRGFK
ncbi:MAG: hypothetical protein HKM04_01675 [Legionellales bacterium]|nr:hypothetical protein [Legionellales bacterium]